MSRNYMAAAISLLLAPAGLAQDIAEIPAQTFQLDPSHASLVFSVRHLGLSNFTAGFDRLSASLELDPANPETARLSAKIDATSLDLPSPPDGFLNDLLGPSWHDATGFPEISYVSDSVTLTGPDTARIDGTLTLLGTSAPVALTARFNGAYPAKLFEPHARIGFSATGTFSRSVFGMTIGVPPAGSDLGVGDEVAFRIEAEFIGEPAAQ